MHKKLCEARKPAGKRRKQVDSYSIPMETNERTFGGGGREIKLEKNTKIWKS